jgi:Tol biopolymer transport system component
VDTDSDLFVMPIDGGEPVAVATTAQSENFVAWAPDGLSVIFSKRVGGSTGLWLIPVVDGRGAGEPKLLWDSLPWWTSLGLSRDGMLAFTGEREALTNLYLASVDFANGRVERAAARVGWVDQNAHGPAWSPDGTRLAFSTNLPSAAIGVQTMASRQLRRFPLAQFRTIGFASGGVTWSADGRSLLFTASDSTQATGFYKLDVESATVTTLLSPANSGVPPFTPPDLRTPRDRFSIIGWSPDGLFVYKRVSHASTTRQVSVSEHRVADGREREIFRSAGPAGIIAEAFSSDGRSLAFVLNHFGPPMTRTLEVLSLVDGSLRSVRQLTSSPTSASWTPDGTALLLPIYRPGSTEGNVNEVWVYPLDGSEPRKTALAGGFLRQLVVHPDGKQVAYTSHSPDRTTDIWLLENFLPKAAAKGGAGMKK